MCATKDRLPIKARHAATVRLKGELRSSSVQLYLIVAGEQWELASIGPDHVTPRAAEIDVEPNSPGKVVMVVDGVSREWDVLVKRGSVPFDTNIPIANRT